MADKTFVVTHAKARAPITVTGKNLEDALQEEGLDPTIWKEVQPLEQPQEPGNGQTD